MVGESEKAENRDGVTPVTMRLARAVASMDAIQASDLIGGSMCGTTGRHGATRQLHRTSTRRRGGPRRAARGLREVRNQNKPVPRHLTAAGRWWMQ